MDNLFESSFGYKLIYVFEIRDEQHKKLLKIGDTTIKTDESIDKLPPNCKALNQAAKERIKEYTNTAGIVVELLHTELAVHTVKDKTGALVLKAFRDKQVHKVLENSGIPKKKIKGSTSQEWFKVDLVTALKAIDAVKKNLKNLSNTNSDNFTPIVFRPEQKMAISKTLEQFKHGNKILWNAKMRFGKTLSALEVTKKSKFAKTIIITHRPVVNDGWYEDFGKIFHGIDNYVYGSKNNGYTVEELIASKKNFVYFASMQDLRGSDAVGGKFNKNDVAFSLDWDFVIVDEAHEGTTTALGNEVIQAIVKENTKFLALSGTPFNILDNYDDNVYTWDYVMEQQQKHQWDKLHFGDSNPYDELPELKIFTYDLGKLISSDRYVELEDKAFNFREFFRVWTGDMKSDRKPLPVGKTVGNFYHADDVKSFLNLITKADSTSHYPYATEEYRNLFKHSLWMVPGVKEAKALSKMMKNHPVFSGFNIVNVAGNGDEEEKTEDALDKVKIAINDAGEDGYTITLSCGKLTTGVTVPEWNAVFMLSGSFSTSAANYLQTIFRVQSPCNKSGKIKQCCYVFDFAPDRTLKMVAESVAISTKAGKADETDRRIMGEFLNYCPVISVDDTQMKAYDTGRLLQQLKRAYADRAVKNGFDDNSLYNDELLKLDEIDLSKFNNLKKIVGASKAAPKAKDVDINNQGFTDEEYEELKKINKKPKNQRTPEEEEKLAKIKKQQKQKNTAISILRGISIRMPLLIYGADIDIKEDFTIDMFLDDNIVDPDSWEEFMPKDVTKEIFKDFMQYYDPEIFISAGRKIRNTVKSADELLPTERVIKIAELFSCFKNPDKETVLTPWRVVNMHMGDCLGGYDFFNEEHDDNDRLKKPRFIDQGKVTKDTLANKNAQILEINSKTGLYPLYVVYTIFRSKYDEYKKEELTAELQYKLWNDTVEKNIFVICKTPMAKSITKRTLVGFSDENINAHYFDDLINTMKNKQKQFADRVTKPSYWNLKGSGKMKFDAIVGNPPYMEMDGGAQASASPIYQYFIKASKKLNPNYTSFIIPTRWYAGGKGLDKFRDEMLNDKNIKVLHDFLNPETIFPNTNIRGGVCYFLWDSCYDNKKDLTKVVTHENNKITGELYRSLKIDGSNIFIRDLRAIKVLEKVCIYEKSATIAQYMSPRKPFGIDGNYIKTDNFNEKSDGLQDPIKCYGKAKIIGYIESNCIKAHRDMVDTWKVYLPYANNIGTELNDDNQNTFVGEPNSVCTETFLICGAELSLDEKSATNLSVYLKTKFARFLHSLAKVSQHGTSKTYQFVPLQDFTEKSDINWNMPIKEINMQLYKKYNLTDDEIAYIEGKIKDME